MSYRLYFIALSYFSLLSFLSIAAECGLGDGIGGHFPCDDSYHRGRSSDHVHVSSHFPSSYYSSDRYDIFHSDDSSGYSFAFGLNGLERNLDIVPGVNNELEPDLFIEEEEWMFCPCPKRWLKKLVRAYNCHKYCKCLKYTRIYETTLLSRGPLPFAFGHINKHQRRIIRSYRCACKRCLRHCRSSNRTSSFTSSCSSYSSSGSSDSSSCKDQSRAILTRAMGRMIEEERDGNVFSAKASKDLDALFDAHWDLASVNYESGEPVECKKILKNLSDEFNRTGLSFNSESFGKGDGSPKDLAKKILFERDDDASGEFKEELLFNLLVR